MAERFEMTFKNKELKMWFIIMVPAFIIGSIMLSLNNSSTFYLHFLILIIGYIVYYSWRFHYRKKTKRDRK